MSLKLVFLMSVVVVTVSISVSLLVGWIMRKFNYNSVEDYIVENSTRYRALANCRERIKYQVYSVPKRTEREVYYVDVDSYNHADFNEIAQQLALRDKSFIINMVHHIKKNYSLMEEYQAIDNADYEEYSEQEYEQFLWKADIEMQEYLDVEHEMCGLLVPDIPVEFSYVVSKVLYVRGTDNILEKKSKEFSVFDVYKFITQAQPTEDEKAFEKQCIKERLKLDSYTCQFCGARKSDKVKIGVAYVIKPSSGGVVSVDNMMTLCQNCTGKLNHM